ncbi:MAG: hypothetical protein EOO01_25570 [Chitinophagaceae bacterium]|nr:MAG: hypothetical protein EOO01_25570 [Chitinophagaceae bacterium]
MENKSNHKKPGIPHNWIDESVRLRINAEMKPRNFTELCDFFNYSPWTMRRKLKEMAEKIGPRIGYFYTVVQQEIMIKLIGPPYTIEETGD